MKKIDDNICLIQYNDSYIGGIFPFAVDFLQC